MSLTGQTLQDRYRIYHQIGEGGMGRVYYAEDIRLNQAVAIKETLNLNSNESTQQITARVKAFQREAHLLAGKIKHHAIPRVIDYFQLEGNWYIVMDYVDGDSLEKQLKERGEPFPIREVLLWTDQLLEILDSLHSGEPQIIHCDIKPSNIKVKNGKVYLLDFGLAKRLTGSKTSIAFLTPAYAPPEHKKLTARSDLYSVGATMYCLLTNTEPASAFSRSLAIASGEVDPLEPIKDLRTDLPTELANLIMRTLSIKAEERPYDAKIMQMKLRDFLMERGQTSTPTLSSYEFLKNDKPLPYNFLSNNVSPEVTNMEEKIEDSGAIGRNESQPTSSSSSEPSISSSSPDFNAPFQSNSSNLKNQNWKKIAASVALLVVIVLSGASIYKYLIDKNQTPPGPTKTPRQIASEKTEQAMEMLYINNYEKAKALSKEAIDNDSTYALAYAIYGDAFWDEDQTEEEDSSKNTKSQISKGEILKLFDTKEPVTTEDLAARAWAFLANKKWERAKQDIEKVATERPDWAWALMQKAFVVIGSGCVKGKDSPEVLEAIDALRKVNSLKPKYAVAYMNLAGAYRCNKRNPEALAAYGRALDLRSLPQYYVRRGNFYLELIEKKTKQENIERAKKDFTKALEIDPELSDAHVGLAQIHQAKEEYKDCITEADKALSKKQSFQAYFHRAICRSALASKEKDEKGFDEALENLEKARKELKYDDPVLHQNTLASYYSNKATIHYNKAFYLFTDKFSKNKTEANKNSVKTELENARSSINNAIENNQDKSSVKDYEKSKREIEKTIALFKRNFG
jgi:serine/threonine protein kinase